MDNLAKTIQVFVIQSSHQLPVTNSYNRAQKLNLTSLITGI